MLRLEAFPDCLLDAALPEEVKVLSGELARADELFSDPGVLAPFRVHWAGQGAQPSFGRPSLAMATYVRLMWLKQKTGWGYERLMREVNDSFSLRRFCRIPITEDVPDESTVRKLTRRLGPEVVDEVVRHVIEVAVSQRGFRPRALRADSTVAEADVRYPTDVGLAADAVRVLAKAARKVTAAVPDTTRRVRNRSRAVNKRVRAIGRSLRKRTGEAKAEVQRLTEEAAAQVRSSVSESKKLLAEAEASSVRAEGVSAKARAKAIARLTELVGLSERIVDQVRARFAGEKIPDRLVSLFDPDARPVRRAGGNSPNPMSSATSCNTPRSRPTPSVEREPCSSPPSCKPAPPTRTPSSPKPPPSSPASGSPSRKPHSTPASPGPPSRKPSPDWSGSSSPGPPTTPGRPAPAGASPNSGWAAKDVSPT